MKIRKWRMAMALLFAASSLAAQTATDPKAAMEAASARQRAVDAKAAMDAALAKQRAAASAMQESLARQRASVEQQTGQAGRSGFFLLPPPASMGAAVAAPAPAATDCDPLPAAQVDTLVSNAAKRQEMDEAVLRTVMQQESAFRPCAVSPKGAMGLMQLMPATASDAGVANPFDPAANVEAGAKLLKELLTRYNGNLPLALGAYNAGPAKVDSEGAVPQIPETQEYVKRILSLLPFK